MQLGGPCGTQRRDHWALWALKMHSVNLSPGKRFFSGGGCRKFFSTMMIHEWIVLGSLARILQLQYRSCSLAPIRSAQNPSQSSYLQEGHGWKWKKFHRCRWFLSVCITIQTTKCCACVSKQNYRFSGFQVKVKHLPQNSTLGQTVQGISSKGPPYSDSMLGFFGGFKSTIKMGSQALGFKHF